MKYKRHLILLAAISPWTQALLANVVGTDLQNFNTTTSGIDYVTVESSEALGTGLFNFGFALNYAVNSLPVFESESQTQTRFKANDTLMTTEYNLGVGLFKNFEVGLSFPEIVRQKVDAQDIAHGSFNAIGLTSIRVGAKYRLWSNARYGIAIASSANLNRIRNNPYLGTGDSPIYNAFVVADAKLAGWSLATNIGYRWRKPADARPGSAITPTKNQLITSAAASYLLTKIDTKFIAEVFGSRPTEKSTPTSLKRQSSSAEALMALKYDINAQLSTYAGGGTELINGASSPDWRAFAGINWTIGPTFGPRTATEPLTFTTVPPAAPAPAAAQPAPEAPKQKETITLHSIQFKFGSDNEVNPGSMDMIKKIAEHIKQPPEYKSITIKGHTDSVGSDESNLKLSQRRANTVRDALIKMFGLDPKRIEAIGMGESSPIADNGNYQGRQENRRVEFIIIR